MTKQDSPAPRTAWDRYLVVFMRVVAVLWVLKGLVAWAGILAPGSLGLPAFDQAPWAIQSALMAFAVLDLVAGVGLWLTSTWGGVMWLLAVMTHLSVAILGPVLPGGRILAGAEVVLVLAYVALSWLASREA